MRIPFPLLALVVALGLVTFPGGLTVPTPAVANGCDGEQFAGGMGSEADPFLIATRAQLISLSTQGGRCPYAFRQTADIDLSDHSWTPIGDVHNAFGGTYDGGGYRISGITVDTGGESLGFFGRVSGATIRDLVLVAPRIVGVSPNTGRGALAGNAVLSTIRSVHAVGGSVEGTTAIGGLVGRMYETEVRGSSSSASVSGDDAVGGLVGFTCTMCVVSLSADASPRAPAPTSIGIFDSAATGSVRATGGAAGGLVGESASDIVRSYATGAVSAGAGTAGGLVGSASAQVVVGAPIIVSEGIVDAYATGTVNAPVRVGGLVGVTRGGPSITRSFAVGRVEGAAEAGGLVGASILCPSGVHVGVCSAEPAVSAATASFWDVGTTGQATSLSGYGEGRTSAQMKTEATFAQAGWKIAGGWRTASDTAVWGICEGANGGYPFLLWQYDATTETCTTTPSAPRDLSVTPGLRQIVATWQSPASDGYAPITSYTVTATPVGAGRSSAKSCTAEATTTTCTITGLRAGRYTISATAANIKGIGASATVRARVAASLRVVQRRCPAGWSARTKRLARCTTATVPAGGILRQVGTVRVGSARAVVCRFSIRVPRAGAAGLACRLNARGRALARDRALTVRLVTTFDPFAGADARRVTVVRYAARGPVTG